MGFWIIAAALALAVAGSLVLALVNGRGAAEGAEADGDAVGDVALYRDQLAEVERDLARGVIEAEEAERARVEIKRRLLEADRLARARAGARRAPRAATLTAAAVVAVGVGAGALGLYARVGAPGYPDLPLAERLAAAEAARRDRPGQEEMEAQIPAAVPGAETLEPRYAQLMDRLRQVVAERPDDLQGQTLLARNEAALGNYRAAWRAQAKVIALKGEEATADDRLFLAELMIRAANGYVSPEAERALAEVLRRKPDDPVARFYMGLMYAQFGRPDRAFALWQPLLEEGPADAPWVGSIREQIAQVAADAGIRYTPPPVAGGSGAPGPDAADVAAAAQMSAEERQAMIEGMVARLSDRLASEGGPPEDWARLIRALGVLGRGEEAARIWEEARGVFSADAAAMATLTAAATQAGVTGAGVTGTGVTGAGGPGATQGEATR